MKQYLGYEERAYSEYSIPNPPKRYNNKITQQLVKLTEGDTDPIRLTTYDYNELGDLIAADYEYTERDLGDNEELLSDLEISDDDTKNDVSVSYHLNGRIKTKSIGNGVGGTYNYKTKKNQLDYISGAISEDTERGLGSAGDFDYDERGALVEDKAKGMKIEYGYDMMPVRTIVEED